MMPNFDLSVYFITDPSARLGVVETARAAAQGGATLVQLRDKTLSDEKFIELGIALRAALAPFGVPLLVNDRVALAKPIGAQGAHVGQSDIGAVQAREILGPNAILGLSIEAVSQAAEIPDCVDYLGVGPLKPTSTKYDAAEPMGIEGLASIKERSALPLVAIGGMTALDAPIIKSAGGSGLAVVSAICGADDPEAATRTIAEAWRNA